MLKVISLRSRSQRIHKPKFEMQTITLTSDFNWDGFIHSKAKVLSQRSSFYIAKICVRAKLFLVKLDLLP